MRSLAAPMIIAPDADSMASTWNSGPRPPRGEVAVGDQGGQRHGDRDHDLDEDVKPSKAMAPAMVTVGPVGGDAVPLEERRHQGCHRDAGRAAACPCAPEDLRGATRTPP